jgi:hypothetical protein
MRLHHTCHKANPWLYGFATYRILSNFTGTNWLLTEWELRVRLMTMGYRVYVVGVWFTHLPKTT